jgi:hypothetical protein
MVTFQETKRWMHHGSWPIGQTSYIMLVKSTKSEQVLRWRVSSSTIGYESNRLRTGLLILVVVNSAGATATAPPDQRGRAWRICRIVAGANQFPISCLPSQLALRSVPVQLPRPADVPRPTGR